MSLATLTDSSLIAASMPSPAALIEDFIDTRDMIDRKIRKNSLEARDLKQKKEILEREISKLRKKIKQSATA